MLWDFILALWWCPAPERRPTCKFPTFKFLNFPYSLRTYLLPAPQGCQSAQTLHYITLHYITLHYITLHYHGILQLALYKSWLRGVFRVYTTRESRSKEVCSTYVLSLRQVAYAWQTSDDRSLRVIYMRNTPSNHDSYNIAIR